MEQQEQTAVEWLQECLNLHLTHDQKMQFEGLFQQAKEMEKQQNKKYLLMGAVIVADEYGKTD